MTDERWLPVPGHVRYEISSRGRVRSLRYRKTRRRRLLRLGGNGEGYKSVELGRGARFYVHRLVLESFLGACHDGMECRHLNGRRGDNRVENLAWGTKGQNGQDKRAHGSAAGERNGFSVLTDERVTEMRSLRAGGSSYSELGSRFRVHKSTARLACLGETWGHIK